MLADDYLGGLAAHRSGVVAQEKHQGLRLEILFLGQDAIDPVPRRYQQVGGVDRLPWVDAFESDVGLDELSQGGFLVQELPELPVSIRQVVGYRVKDLFLPLSFRLGRETVR